MNSLQSHLPRFIVLSFVGGGGGEHFEVSPDITLLFP